MLALPVYLAAALAVLWVARRWVGPIGRRSGLALLLLPLALTGPALLSSRVLAPLDLLYNSQPFSGEREALGVEVSSPGLFTDVFSQMIPWRTAVRYALAQGEWPLWNPFILCGDILAASAQPAPYSPVMLLGLALPLAASLELTATLALFLAGLGTFLLARELGCRGLTALFAAAGFTASHYLVFWLGWPLGGTTAYLPWVLLGTRRAIERPGWRSTGLLTTAFVLAILAGHPETTAHIVLAALFAAGFWWWELKPARPLAAAATGLGAGALALAITAVFWLPILDVMPETAEHAYRQAIFATADRSAPWGTALLRLVPSFLPVTNGRFTLQRFHLPVDWSYPSTAYAGSLLLAPALYGLVRSRLRVRWLLAGLGLFGLLAGVQAPGVADLLAKLPPFDLAINDRLIQIAALAIPLLAGLGLEAWLAEARPGEPGERSRRFVWLHAAILAGLAVSALAASRWLMSYGMPAAPLLRWAPTYLLPLALALAALFVLPTRRGQALALLGLLVAQRAVETRLLLPTVPLAAVYPDLSLLQKLPPSPSPYRVTAIGYLFIPNTSAAYHLEDVRGYQAMRLRRLVETYPLWTVYDSYWFNRVDNLASPFLRFLNVRFALTEAGRPYPPDWREVGRHAGALLLRNRTPMKRAFVPERIRLGGKTEQVRAEMAAETDFSQRAWISIPGTPEVGEPVGRRNGVGSVALRTVGLGYELDTTMAEPGWVVISVTAWKGWRAFLGDEELPLAYANHAFLALKAPAGNSRIRLVYRPRAFEVGRAISLGTIAVLLLAGLGWILRGKTPQHP